MSGIVHDPCEQLRRVQRELRDMLDDRESRPSRMCVGYRDRISTVCRAIGLTLEANNAKKEG